MASSSVSPVLPQTIHASNGGYDAWTRSPGGKNNYEYHPNNFCDCTGDGSCSEWVYESRLVDQVSERERGVIHPPLMVYSDVC